MTYTITKPKSTDTRFDKPQLELVPTPTNSIQLDQEVFQDRNGNITTEDEWFTQGDLGNGKNYISSSLRLKRIGVYLQSSFKHQKSKEYLASNYTIFSSTVDHTYHPKKDDDFSEGELAWFKQGENVDHLTDLMEEYACA